MKKDTRVKTPLQAAIWIIALFLATTAFAQDRHDDHNQFDEHDRQVTRDWYNQQHDHYPRGLRPDDRLDPQWEGRLATGVPYDREFRHRAHSVPRDLLRQLPPAPRHHRYMVLDGHIVLVDTRHNIVRDVIHLHP